MLTPSQCGRMDQCVVMGPGAVGLMEFSGTGCTLKKLTFGRSNTDTGSDAERSINCKDVEEGLYFVVVDLKSSKDTVAILRDLNACFPVAQNETQVRYIFMLFA